MPSPLLDDRAVLSRFRKRLLAWHAERGRDLPWRRSRDPYVVWISEIMLQQTTVAAVVPYFERFLARFPDVRTLAASDEHDVLRAWEGLGYYSRARNLHRTAQRIVAEHAGRFPETVDALQELPGIGRYTAGAIVSFAFDRPAPILEANTLRLESRLLGLEADPRSAAGQRALWECATRLVPDAEPGRFNSALMDLGATVCTPTDPDCPACPVSGCCAAFAAGRQAEIPVPAKRAAVTDLLEAAVAVRRADGCWWLRRRGPQERWAGLWDFPRFGLDDLAADDLLPGRLFAAVADRVRESTGLATRVTGELAEIKHSVTRYRIRLRCFTAELVGGQESSSSPATNETSLPITGESAWFARAALAELALSTTGRKLARAVSGSDRDDGHRPGSPG